MILDPIAYWLQQIGALVRRVDSEQHERDPHPDYPAKQAAKRVLRDGRTMHLAMGADGAVHLRRRARQIRRDFGRGISWMALRRSEAGYGPRRWRLPWWWI